MIPYTPAESRLSRVLNSIALIAAALCALTLFGAYRGPATTFFVQPPLVSDTAAGLGLLALLAWFAAADVRRYRPMITILIGGLALSAGTFLALTFSPHGQDQASTLLAGVVTCSIATLALGLLVRHAPVAAPTWMPWMTDKPLTPWERGARNVVVAFGLISVFAAGATLALAFVDPSDLVDFFQQPLMVGGAAVKMALLGVCALWAATDMRRYTELFTLVILGGGIAFIAALITLAGISRFGSALLTVNGVTLSARDMMLIAVAVNASALTSLVVLKIRMSRALLDALGFFTPMQFRAFEAVSEALIEGGASEKVPPYQIALRTDRYLSSFRSSRLWLAKLAVLALEFAPLLALKPPLSFLNPALRREFVDRHFKRDIVRPRGLYWVLDRVGPRRILDLIEGAVRFNIQLTYLGYYSHPDVQQAIGYAPFSQRPGGATAKPIRRHAPLRVMTPGDLASRGIDVISSADVVIIGSGAAGSILAEQLAAQGREVLLLEKGLYVKPDDFSEDEVDQISRLYSDGALQISQALRFTILQGSCVGGTTVVNNAVCFDTPDRVLTSWNDPHCANAGIHVDAFRRAQAAVRQRLSIQSIACSTSAPLRVEDVLNPGDGVIGQGVMNFLQPGSYEYEIVRANITECVGCGYCNIGCKYGRKLSMLDEVLPKAQASHGADKFRILSEAEVVKLKGRNGHVTEIVVRLGGQRELFIQNPKTVILSAGTIASSWLLMQSGIGQGELPVGRGLSFNMGSPLHGRFEQKLNSYAGLQIAHYLSLNDRPGFVYETWYNPPVAQALAMPGWLDTHFRNMQNYNRMVGVGVLVGTEPNPDAHLARALFLRGAPDIVYTPTARDLNTLVEALITLGKIMFAGGAQEVFASTRRYQSYSRGLAAYRSEGELEKLRSLVSDERDILLGTGHPQGGNALSATRGRNGKTGGVVGPNFKVYGYDNLYVCDASIFPSATTVNPQLTVMTLAHYAASFIE
ncbi:MAG TPA: GMC family oxidoreductase [Anaerolineae bacterium]|nr:GMC family oxidoreductase [Anaerolineae bacterium]